MSKRVRERGLKERREERDSIVADLKMLAIASRKRWAGSANAKHVNLIVAEAYEEAANRYSLNIHHVAEIKS